MPVLGRLLARLLRRVLDKYFDSDKDAADDGPLSFGNLRCRTESINAALKAGGHPFELVDGGGCIRRVQIEMPSSKSFLGGREKLVVRISGVLLLVRTSFEYDDDALRGKLARERKEQLERATVQLRHQQQQQQQQGGGGGTKNNETSNSTSSGLVDWLKSYLQDIKLLNALTNRIEILIEDVHVRVEDRTSEYAFGLVLENLHIRQQQHQQEQEQQQQQQESTIVGCMYQLGVYWNYDCETSAPNGGRAQKHNRPEHTILQDLPPDEIARALDRTIPRRMAETAPAHTYLLIPVDGSVRITLDATVSGTPQQQQQQQQQQAAANGAAGATFQVAWNVPYLHYEVRDVSCWQAVRLVGELGEYKAHRSHRIWRPRVSVRDDPRAWWHYAATCIRYQLRHRLRWSLGRFHRQYLQRQRYCQLYQQSREDTISSEDAQELDAMESGTVGDLSVQDIVLFRILVEKRMGLPTTSVTSSNGSSTRSWFRRESEDDQDYQELLDYWVDFTGQNGSGRSAARDENGSTNGGGRDNDVNGSSAPPPPPPPPPPLAVLSAALHVETGKVTFYSPLALESSRHLQQKFLELTFTRFDVGLTLMRDFESMAIRVALFDYVASEVRSTQKICTVVTRANVLDLPTDGGDSTASHQQSEQEPLFALLYTKNPPLANDFHVGIQARVRALRISLQPDCEWIMRLRAFIQLVPQFHKASKFWEDLSMANFNSWASDRLGLLVKAHTAAAGRKNIDFDVKVDCPIIRAVDGEGNVLVIDLGHAHVWTEKLVGVADTLMVSVTSKFTGGLSTPPSFPQSTTNAFNGDASSFKTPPRLSPLRRKSSVSKSYVKSKTALANTSADSVNLGTSLEHEGLANLPYPGVLDEVNDQSNNFEGGTDALFYDIFELQFQPGAVTIQSIKQESWDIVSPMDFQIVIQKSILPTDHTMCRLKVRCTVEEVSVSISEQSIVAIARLLSNWADILASKMPLSTVSEFQECTIQTPADTKDMFVDQTDVLVLDNGSSFDENAFFDAVEHDSHASPLLEEHWITDSESVVDSETRASFSRDRRRRHGQSSVSDVSSVSESSVPKRKAQLQDNDYLSAENLARLEEEGGVEDSLGDAESCDDSFHSAFSAGYLISLEQDLDNDIQATEIKLQLLRNKITKLRHNKEDAKESGEVSRRENSKQRLRLDLQRTEAELKVLRAALCDLVSQRKSVELEENPARCTHNPESIRRASTLLQRRKDDSGGASVTIIEHSMTRNLKRELFQLSFTLKEARLRLTGLDKHSNGISSEKSSIVVSCSHFGVVLHQSVGELKLYASIENVNASFLEASSDHQRQISFLNGGVNYDLASSLLPSRFPQFLSSSSMEEKLMRCAFEVRTKHLTKDRPLRSAKMRLVLGDVEFAPHQSVVKMLLEVASSLKSKLAKKLTLDASQSLVLEEKKSVGGGPPWTYIDFAVRLSAVRVVLYNGEQVGALALTEVASRFVQASSNKVYKDRSQLDMHCSNMQVIAIHDVDSGKGVEIVGKKDPYGSILRLRFRHQLVPEAEVAGWVTGAPSAEDTGQTPEAECVCNAHLGIKLDGFSVTIIPESVHRMSRGLRELLAMHSRGDTNPASMHQNGESSSQAKPFKDQLARWRVDLSLRKSSVVFAEMLSEAEDGLGDPGQEKIVAFLAASASVQPTVGALDRVLLQMKALDIMVVRSPGDSPILEPMHISINIQAPSTIKHRSSTRHPQLELPKECFWNVSGMFKGEPRECGSSIPALDTCTDSQAVLVDVSISHVRVPLVPSSVFLLLKLSNSLKHIEEKAKIEANQSRPSPSNSSVCIFCEGATISLDREPIISPSHHIPATDKVAALHIEGIQMKVNKSKASASYCAAVSYGTLTDYSCRSGVVMGSGGTRGEMKAGQLGLGPGLDLFTLKWKVRGISEQISAQVEMCLGRISFLPLPSCVRGVLSFMDDTKALFTGEEGLQTPKTEESISLLLKARKVKNVSFSIQAESLECVLSSKDIPKHVRESSRNPIGVVIMRLKINANGVVRVSLLDTAEEMLCDQENNRGLENTMKHFLDRRVSQHPSIAFSSDLQLRISDVQVLRTTILKREGVRPVVFEISPPSAGEQRITNLFSFSIVHNATAASFASSLGGIDSNSNKTSLAHSVKLEAEFIDVLVYVAQSEGGLNESLRTTIIPIMELTKKESKTEQTPLKDSDIAAKQDMKELLLNAPLVTSIYLEGFRLTCVPGGATRLTESPIVKVALLDLSSGFAASSISSDWELHSDSSLEKLETVPSMSAKHLLAGGWLNCEVSASYHNRRLVMWEPFVEPWRFEVVFGSDVSRAAKLHPVLEKREGSWLLQEEKAQSPRISALDLGAGRLRDIGRLLRSPFKSENSAEKENNADLSTLLNSDVDFCYLRLLSMAKNTIRSASYPIVSSGLPPPLSVLPGNSPVHWLNHFGYPTDLDPSQKGLGRHPMFMCRLSDSMPLNINLTGALVENLSQYLGEREQGKAERLAPHRIRNDSGLTLRFREVLDVDRLSRGERSSKVTLSYATEAPLSLKRSLSQSCDPHMAYITIELGSFEDTIGRVSTNLHTPKGTRSSSFSYKVAAKIPVDKVGLHTYPLDWNADKQGHASAAVVKTPDERSLGWVIVRVALQGGIKMVTVQSPLFFKNTSDTDLLCEVRDHDGLLLLWRSLVPKASHCTDGCLAVPADIVPIIHSKSHSRFTVMALPCDSSFRHESDLPICDKNLLTRLSPPRPYSRSSLSKGIIETRHESLHLLKPEPNSTPSALHFDISSVRIGSFALELQARGQGAPKSEFEVPEQRMMLFRSPLAVMNHLAFPVRVQVKVKEQARAFPQNGDKIEAERNRVRRSLSVPQQWFDLGIIECGEGVSWTGAAPSEEIEMRVRFENREGTVKREFPSWSTATTVPTEMRVSGSLPNASPSATPFSRLQDLKVLDSSKVPLLLSAVLSKKLLSSDLAASYDDIKQYSEEIPSASRVISLFTPFWVVDGTGLDLQYKLGSFLAGQIDLDGGISSSKSQGVHEAAPTLGLGELLDDSDLVYLPSRLSFEVLMIGDARPKRLHVRRRQTRQQTVNNLLSPWSEAISLILDDNSFHDTTIPPPSNSFRISGNKQSQALESFALRFRLVQAPDMFGGMFGTKIVHVVCRYAVVNELGREIEICGWQKEAQPTVFDADSRPRPFHFDDRVPIHFRPLGFGWIWSGRFHVRRDRREVTLRLKHKLKGHTIIVNVEFHSKQKAGTCLIVFRLAPHAPYRVENRTVYPIQFRQISSLFEVEGIALTRNNAVGTIILPYHDAEFAWDDPESGRRAVGIRLADLGDVPDNLNRLLGTFRIDRITPGTYVPLANPNFLGQVVSDGPTRVIRLSEAARSESGQSQIALHEDFQKIEEQPSLITTWMLTVKLSHGVGISVVDWSPQELLYIRLDDLAFEQVNDGTKETGNASVGRIIVNNQLWVTPYPVLLRMGSRSSRRRNRRQNAIAFSWCRTDVAYGDMTFFQSVELNTEPVIISVDGDLAAFLIGMMQHVRQLGASGGSRERVPRNSELRQVLDIVEPAEVKGERTDRKSLLADDLYSAVDYMATAAIAAKLRYRYRPPDQTSHIVRKKHPLEIVHHNLLSQKRHKYYIEHLRISTTAAEISWSGALPIASGLPRFLRPALTFVGLPVLVRPFSQTHAYGTTDDHIQTLKAHYISVWRIVDFVVGVLANPTFLVRACIYTWTESLSTACDMLSSSLASSESALLSFISSPNQSKKLSKPMTLCCAAFEPIIKFQAAVIHGIVALTSAGTRILHYNAARQRASGGLVRSRNPRLFANVDGQDLLVSYVEGENAGRALLSRVRMGAHLSEGYAGHIEGVHFVQSRPKYQTDMDPSDFIVMLTFDRILLLNGQLNAFFCDVVWEAQFTELVHIESREVSDVPAYALVLLWFLHDGSSSSKEEHQAKALVNDTWGLEALACKQFFISKVFTPLLFTKINQINPHLIDPHNLQETMTQ